MSIMSIMSITSITSIMIIEEGPAEWLPEAAMEDSTYLEEEDEGEEDEGEEEGDDAFGFDDPDLCEEFL